SKRKNTRKSDIYSIGMLMWEIFSGRPPFDDRAHDPDLILKICEGLRPSATLPGMPKEYAEMMRKCWDDDPTKRPTIKELFYFAYNFSMKVYKNEYLNDDEITTTTLDTTYNSNNNDDSQSKSHALAYRSSRILDDDIAKSKELKSNHDYNNSLNHPDISLFLDELF